MFNNKTTGLAMAMALLAGCGGGSSASGTGSMTLRLTDAPVDSAARVVVEFSGVELIHSDGGRETFDFETPRQIDLLALDGGETTLLLDGVTVDAGTYSQIRLMVNAGATGSDSYIELEDGGTYPLYIPSGNQTGLKLVGGFSVPSGGSADFTIDFDLRKSVTLPAGLGGSYILRPTLRVVQTPQTGQISGTVDASLATAADCSPVVYVYSGAGAEPDDVGGAVEPVTTARVELDDGTGDYVYTAAFLPAGDYTVAFTCDAADDDPEADDDLTYEPAADASVAAGTTATVDF